MPLRLKPRRRIQPRIIGEAFGYDELLQTVKELRRMRDDFQRGYDKKLEDAEKMLADHQKTHQSRIQMTERQLVEYVKNTRKGDKGDDGHTPIKGIDYRDGEDGEDGKPGRDGKSPNEDSIVKKILRKVTLPKAPELMEIVNAVLKKLEPILDKKLEGIRTQMRQISSKTMLGGGGGGMGTIKYFKFTGDNSTTEFTLPDTPTQEGNATFAFAMGQRLHNTEHFTVSGTTLSLTYTPATDEIIDGWIFT
jgi:hypothetical protein